MRSDEIKRVKWNKMQKKIVQTNISFFDNITDFVDRGKVVDMIWSDFRKPSDIHLIWYHMRNKVNWIRTG